MQFHILLLVIPDLYKALFTPEEHKFCQNLCEALTFRLNNIYIRFLADPPLADLFSFCFESENMLFLSEDKQAEIIEAYIFG